MRIGLLAVFAVCVSFSIVMVASSASAIDDLNACNICTCANGQIACGDVDTEVIEEQGLCASLCAGIGSSGTSGPKLVEAPCSELPPCGNVGAPAAGPLWLSIAALGMLGLGGWTLRRARSRRPA